MYGRGAALSSVCRRPACHQFEPILGAVVLESSGVTTDRRTRALRRLFAEPLK